MPDKLSAENLRKEGVPEHKIQFTGNIMIDTLENNREKASKLKINNIIQNNILSPDRAQANVPLAKGDESRFIGTEGVSEITNFIKALHE